MDMSYEQTPVYVVDTISPLFRRHTQLAADPWVCKLQQVRPSALGLAWFISEMSVLTRSPGEVVLRR